MGTEGVQGHIRSLETQVSETQGESEMKINLNMTVTVFFEQERDCLTEEEEEQIVEFLDHAIACESIRENRPIKDCVIDDISVSLKQ